MSGYEKVIISLWLSWVIKIKKVHKTALASAKQVLPITIAIGRSSVKDANRSRGTRPSKGKAVYHRSIV